MPSLYCSALAQNLTQNYFPIGSNGQVPMYVIFFVSIEVYQRPQIKQKIYLFIYLAHSTCILLLPLK